MMSFVFREMWEYIVHEMVVVAKVVAVVAVGVAVVITIVVLVLIITRSLFKD